MYNGLRGPRWVICPPPQASAHLLGLPTQKPTHAMFSALGRGLTDARRTYASRKSTSETTLRRIGDTQGVQRGCSCTAVWMSGRVDAGEGRSDDKVFEVRWYASWYVCLAVADKRSVVMKRKRRKGIRALLVGSVSCLMLVVCTRDYVAIATFPSRLVDVARENECLRSGDRE